MTQVVDPGPAHRPDQTHLDHPEDPGLRAPDPKAVLRFAGELGRLLGQYLARAVDRGHPERHLATVARDRRRRPPGEI